LDSLFKIPRAKKLPTDVSKIFKAVRDGRRNKEVRWFSECRASSFPICPRAFHICYRLPPSERPFKDESFASEVATMMGDALHAVLQKWFGLQEGTFFGNWKCLDCRKRRRHKYGPQRCKKCGQEMVYEEYDLPKKAKLPFSGHIDGLLRVLSGKYLIDFKGSSLEKIRAIQREGRPYDYHYYQTNAYANAVNMYPKHFGKFGPVDGIIIIYVDRGMANRFWHPVLVPVDKRVFRQCVGLIHESRESLETLRLPNGICSSPRDPKGKWCPVHELCFSRLIDATLKDKVWKELNSKGKKPSMMKRSLVE